MLRKVVLDTNVYVDWLNERLHEPFVLAPGLVRYLPAVVQMELRAGARTRRAGRALDRLFAAYRASKRIVVPAAAAFDEAGRSLRRLCDRGIDVGRASLLNDVLIAHCARAIGATVITRDADYDAIRAVVDFEMQLIP
jgi:predicted nucleic acid-binding protein